MIFSIVILTIVVLFPSILMVVGYQKNNFSDKIIRNGYTLGEGLTGLPEYSSVVGCGGYKFISNKNEYCDCSKVCDSNDYVYKFFSKTDDFIVGNKKLFGGYCIKQAYAKCNLNTSHAIIGKGGLVCISKFPEMLGGESGNQILVCNGKVKDRLLDVEYTTYFPNNVFMTGIDEKLSDGTFRFECFDSENTIPLPSNVGTRLEREENPCSLLDPLGKFNPVSMKCECVNYLNNDEDGICSGTREGYGIVRKQRGSRYGVTLGRDCIDIKRQDYHPAQKLVHFPCGPKNLTVEHAIMQITNTYSPRALENILK